MVIYKITNLINDKIYIGQTVKYLQTRFKEHVRESRCGSQRVISRAIKKYGQENFIVELLEKCSSFDQMNDREMFWIKKLNSINGDIGYNVRIGGNNSPCSETSKRKISEKNKGRIPWNLGIPHSKASIKLMKKNMKGRIPWNKGKHFSEEAKKNISLSLIGKKHTEESNKRRSETLKGRIFSDEHRKNLSIANKKRHRDFNGKFKNEG